MADPHLPTSSAVEGIHNFGWVVPGLVARGEQPPLTSAAFEALRDLGIRKIAHALGSPIEGDYDVLPPERPAEADAWPCSYWDALQPWRERSD